MLKFQVPLEDFVEKSATLNFCVLQKWPPWSNETLDDLSHKICAQVSLKPMPSLLPLSHLPSSAFGVAFKVRQILENYPLESYFIFKPKAEMTMFITLHSIYVSQSQSSYIEQRFPIIKLLRRVGSDNWRQLSKRISSPDLSNGSIIEMSI